MKECGYPDDVSEYEGSNQLGQFLSEVRKVFKEGLDTQMEEAKNAERIRDIEADAVSVAGDEGLAEDNGFKPSQVPGEAYVAAAKHNDQVSKTALTIFRDRALMFPAPVRRFLWEEFIYSKRNNDKKSKVSVSVLKGTMDYAAPFLSMVFTCLFQDFFGFCSKHGKNWVPKMRQNYSFGIILEDLYFSMHKKAAK